MLCELCIDSMEEARMAQQAGVDRVELCENLVEGGTTPSLGKIRRVRAVYGGGLMVLIRPRGGDFCYSSDELDVMEQDILTARAEGADGIVTGVLTCDGDVDHLAMQRLLKAAAPMQVTFHRAFDVCRDPFTALDALLSLGVTRILTSGQRATALEGAALIAKLVEQTQGRIAIMAGGGIRAHTVREVMNATCVREVHFTARKRVESPMLHRNPLVSMGKAYQPDEYVRSSGDAAALEAMLQVLQNSKS